MCGLGLSAQVQVETSIDSVQIWIGEQAHISLNVSCQKGLSLELPRFQPLQQITNGIEFIESTDADTFALDNNMMQVHKVYTITSFDEKLYYIPPMKVKVDGKEYESKSLALKVMTVPVDTLHPENFFPPKDVQNNPFLWKEWNAFFWMSVLALLMAFIAFYLSIRLKDNKPIIAKVHFIKRIPPHQRAMGEIEKIKAERMISSEDQKSYYTRLTDTLRKYIEERFGFNAMEMTSSEIIARLQEADDKNMVDELRDLFYTADLVKFAKYSTLINENDANLVHAIEFINQTKLDTIPTTERIEPILTQQEVRSIRSRKTIKVSILLCSMLAVILFGYVVFKLYLFL